MIKIQKELPDKFPDIYFMNCPKCNGKMGCQIQTQTLVGYRSPEGHNHDDNCQKRIYICNECVEKITISKINKCHVEGCNWTGKTSCWCHEPKEKVEEWPVYIKTNQDKGEDK